MTQARWQLVRVSSPPTMTMDVFAQRSGLHPELVRRFVALGLLDARRGARGELRLDRSQLAVAAKIQRLHAALPINYAGLGLVLDLLDRIQQLENRIGRGVPPWT